MVGRINILSNKIDNEGKKESSMKQLPTNMNEMESFDNDHMDEDTLQPQNESDVQNLAQAAEPQNESFKSTTSNVDTGDKNKSSQMVNSNESVSDINRVDGDMGRINVRLIDHKVLSLIYPVMNSSLLSSVTAVFDKGQPLVTFSYPHLFQI